MAEVAMAATIATWGFKGMAVAVGSGLVAWLVASKIFWAGQQWQRFKDTLRRWMASLFQERNDNVRQQLEEEKEKNRRLEHENTKLRVTKKATVSFGTQLRLENIFRAESSFRSDAIHRVKIHNRSKFPNFVAKLNASLVKISERRLSHLVTASVRDVDEILDTMNEVGYIYGVNKSKLDCPFTRKNAEEVAQRITDALKWRCDEKVVNLVLDWMEELRQLWKKSRRRQAEALDVLFNMDDYDMDENDKPDTGILIIRVDASGRITMPTGREILPYAHGLVATFQVNPDDLII